MDTRVSHHLLEIGILQEYCALGCLLDSNERFDPPRCAEETREAITLELMDWITNDDEAASMAWLYGGAGVGKSALLQSIAELCRRERRHVSSHFFSRTAQSFERVDGNRWIPTFVLQLMDIFEGIRPHIQECIAKNPTIFARSRATQMEDLVLSPLTLIYREQQSWTESIVSLLQKLLAVQHGQKTRRDRRQRLIVIDGLDECQNPDIQCDILNIVANALPRLPFPFRFLISSRPETHIIHTLDQLRFSKNTDILRINLSNDPNAENDIRKFVTRRFQEIRRTHRFRGNLDLTWPSKEAIETIVKKSSGHFFYPNTALRYIQSPKGKPDQRLREVLRISPPSGNHAPFDEMDASYRHILQGIDEADRGLTYTIIGILYVTSGRDCGEAPLKPTLAQIAQCLDIDTDDITLLMDPLLSLIAVPSDPESEMKVLHTTLFDFLLDASRAGALTLDIGTAHLILAEYILKFISKGWLDG